MPSLTAAQICSIARQAAKASGYVVQSGQLLNAILSELCDEQDLDAAKKTFNFSFTGAVAPIGNLNVVSASGPFILPVDYLRAKIGDVIYFPSGLANLPLQLTPVDLSEFDAMLQQGGFQNFPVVFATDMSNASPILTTTGTTHATTTLDGLAVNVSANGVTAGNGVAGQGIVPGTTVVSIAGGGLSVTLSKAATSSVTGGSIFFGVPPIAYVWPPASGAYPCMVRYYSRMPDIVSPETATAIPWFPNTQFLITELTGRLMQVSGDDRWEAFLSDNEELHPGGSRVLLRRFLQLKDDSSNRAQRVKLDQRKFGTAWDRLPRSKAFGGW